MINEEKEPGTYTVTWNGKDNHGNEVSSGVYLYQLNSGLPAGPAGSSSQARKLLLIK